MLRKIGTAHARVFGDAGRTDEDPPMHDAATAHRHRNVERVVAHLQDSIRTGSPLPDLAALAALAHQSPHHFHRVYRALAGKRWARPPLACA